MTKSLFVDPKAVRGAAQPIRFPEIPVNVYQKTVKDELGNFTTEDFCISIGICAISGNLRPCST